VWSVFCVRLFKRWNWCGAMTALAHWRVTKDKTFNCVALQRIVKFPGWFEVCSFFRVWDIALIGKNALWCVVLNFCYIFKHGIYSSLLKVMMPNIWARTLQNTPDQISYTGWTECLSKPSWACSIDRAANSQFIATFLAIVTF